MPLVSGKKLADANCTTITNTHGAWVLNNKTGEIVLKGDLDPITHLWTVPLQPDHNFKPQSKPHLTAQILQLAKEKLTPTTSPRVNTTPSPLPIAASAYEKQSIDSHLSWMHGTTCFPTKRTWIKSIKANNFVGFPGMHHKDIPKLINQLEKCEYTTKGHM